MQFLRWVNSIARLGRLGNTIDKVEEATLSALQRRLNNQAFGCVPVSTVSTKGYAIKTDSIGYLQYIDTSSLQICCEELSAYLNIAVQPGTFIGPGHILAYLDTENSDNNDFDYTHIHKAFMIGKQRVFDDDPRYGLIVLSQIADRAHFSRSKRSRHSY
ncbi:MAG TPA: DUF2254 family protein [Spirochaetota bacterium]|nr:DUF2254 family protein [Spirochaetota bacterium]